MKKRYDLLKSESNFLFPTSEITTISVPYFLNKYEKSSKPTLLNLSLYVIMTFSTLWSIKKNSFLFSNDIPDAISWYIAFIWIPELTQNVFIILFDFLSLSFAYWQKLWHRWLSFFWYPYSEICKYLHHCIHIFHWVILLLWFFPVGHRHVKSFWTLLKGI